jgi:hypothetical protein
MTIEPANSFLKHLIRVRLNASSLIPAIYLVEVVDQSHVTYIIKLRSRIDPIDWQVLDFFVRERIRIGIVAVRAGSCLQVDLINLPWARQVLDSPNMSGSNSRFPLEVSSFPLTFQFERFFLDLGQGERRLAHPSPG